MVCSHLSHPFSSIMLPDNSRPFPKLLFFILTLSLLLNIIGINWGLPIYRGWAADELTPGMVRKGIEKTSSTGGTMDTLPFISISLCFSSPLLFVS